MKACAWQDKEERCVHHQTIIGHFAMWAVRQSPYICPDDLKKGLEEFEANFPDKEIVIKTTCAKFRKDVEAAINLSPTIVGWNSPKDGNNQAFGIESRYESHNFPDHDFIDLDALARNMALSVCLETLYDNNIVQCHLAPAAGEKERVMGIICDVPEGYISGMDRSTEGRQKVSHLYKGDFEDPGLPMCAKGWNRGDSYSIWRDNVGPAGFCKVCIRRAKKGLNGIDNAPVAGEKE